MDATVKYRSECLYEYAKTHIKDTEVWPCFVPSYNRPNAALTSRAAREGFPLVLCIRREQQQMYSQYADKFPMLILDNVNDLSETRESIVQQASQYYDNLFMLDDDINELDYEIPSKTINGKDAMRTSFTVYGRKPRLIDILKMWMLSIQWDKNSSQIALSSIGYRPDNWTIKNANKANVYNSGVISQCIHINTKLIKAKNIHYKPMREVGVEDYSYNLM